MRIGLRRVLWVAGILVAALLVPTARAQTPGRVFPPVVTVSNTRPVVVPTFLNIGVATTATVPDGGTALLGGYSRLSEGRTEYGPPVLGRVPGLGRGFHNAGYGRSVVSGKVTASVRIISLYEEEYRQTGVRSGP